MSSQATNVAEEMEEYREWARTVRTQSPPSSMEEYLKGWEAFFDHYALQVDDWHERNRGYHAAIAGLARYYVPKGARVLEVGSGNGDLLAALEPSHGVGVDLSGEMVRRAAQKYPHLHFRKMSAEQLELPDEKFDVVLLSDLIGYSYDIRLVFERLQAVCSPRTRILLHWYSRLWQPLLGALERLGLKYPQPMLNWTTVDDIRNLLNLADFEVVHHRGHILVPKQVPGLSGFANRYLAHLPGLRAFCLTNWIVARPMRPSAAAPRPRISVICPCRNEAGNIAHVADRLPEMGSHTELIFVEGHSRDDTLARCREVAETRPEKDIKVYVQEGEGKGDAVRLGFAKASGDILAILDADLSVDPEDMPQFCDALIRGKGEFVNGSRLVYAMDPQAMRFFNLLGNRFFALLLGWLLGQPIKDSLCGTKVLSRTDYEGIAAGRAYFGEIDPFGDFDLLFGAAKQNLKIVEVPIRYRQRIYGQTNISRFRHGWLLLRMSAQAARKLLFIA